MDDRSRGPSTGMIQHLRSTRRRDRICILDFSRPAGGPPGLPLVQQLSMQRGPGALLLTQTLMSSEWSLEKKERGRALTEDQMVIAQMRSRRLRRRSQFLLFSTSLVRVCIMVSLRHVCPMYPPMFLWLITEERV